jgi:hypothetical protein
LEFCRLDESLGRRGEMRAHGFFLFFAVFSYNFWTIWSKDSFSTIGASASETEAITLPESTRLMLIAPTIYT